MPFEPENSQPVVRQVQEALTFPRTVPSRQRQLFEVMERCRELVEPGLAVADESTVAQRRTHASAQALLAATCLRHSHLTEAYHYCEPVFAYLKSFEGRQQWHADGPANIRAAFFTLLESTFASGNIALAMRTIRAVSGHGEHRPGVGVTSNCVAKIARAACAHSLSHVERLLDIFQTDDERMGLYFGALECIEPYSDRVVVDRIIKHSTALLKRTNRNPLDSDANDRELLAKELVRIHCDRGDLVQARNLYQSLNDPSRKAAAAPLLVRANLRNWVATPELGNSFARDTLKSLDRTFDDYAASSGRERAGVYRDIESARFMAALEIFKIEHELDRRILGKFTNKLRDRDNRFFLALYQSIKDDIAIADPTLRTTSAALSAWNEGVTDSRKPGAKDDAFMLLDNVFRHILPEIGDPIWKDRVADLLIKSHQNIALRQEDYNQIANACGRLSGNGLIEHATSLVEWIPKRDPARARAYRLIANELVENGGDPESCDDQIKAGLVAIDESFMGNVWYQKGSLLARSRKLGDKNASSLHPEETARGWWSLFSWKSPEKETDSGNFAAKVRYALDLEARVDPYTPSAEIHSTQLSKLVQVALASRLYEQAEYITHLNYRVCLNSQGMLQRSLAFQLLETMAFGFIAGANNSASRSRSLSGRT